jgi:hypothetical protein
MRVLFRVKNPGAFANRLHEPLFPKLLGRRFGDEAAAAARADKLVHAFN